MNNTKKTEQTTFLYKAFKALHFVGFAIYFILLFGWFRMLMTTD